MRYLFIKQFQAVNTLTKAVVLFWPLWFMCVTALVISMMEMQWEPPVLLIGVLAMAPVLMLGIVVMARFRRNP